MGDRRGLSAIISVVLLVLIVIVAVGLLWFYLLPVFTDSLVFSGFENEFVILEGDYTLFDWESRTISVQVERVADNLAIDGLTFYFSYRETSISQYVPINLSLGGSKTIIFEFSDYKDITDVKIASMIGDKVSMNSNIVSDLPESDLKDLVYEYFIWDDFVKDLYNMSGLVSWWRMDYANSVYIEDFKGGNDGLIDPDAHSYFDGYWGGALNFNGTKDGLEVNDSDSLDLIDEISLVAWVNMNDEGNYPKILEKDIDYDKPGTGLWEAYVLDMLGETGSPRFMIANATPHNIDGGIGHYSVYDTAFNTSCGDCGFGLNEWHFIVGTYDGDVLTLYVDSNEISTTDVPDSFGTIYNSDDPLYIGEGPVPDSSFNGLIDEVMVFNRSLDAGEVGDLYNHFVEYQGYR